MEKCIGYFGYCEYDADAEVRCIRCEIKTIIGTRQAGHVNILIGICDRLDALERTIAGRTE